MVTLLPNLEQDSLYRQFDLKKGYAGNLPAAMRNAQETNQRRLLSSQDPSSFMCALAS
jgi:hypothetical protein